MKTRTALLTTALALATTTHAGTTGEMLDGSAETFRPPKKHEIPLGHPDFYPSDERPVGWRGDRTGAFPGAKGVDHWDVTTGENIVWTANPPAAGASQPMVVGEKVLLTCGENILVCYNVHNGSELWRTIIDHTEKMDKATREKCRAEMAYLDGLEKQRGRWAMEVEKLCLMVKKAGGDMKAVLKAPKKAHHHKLEAPDADPAFAGLLTNAELKDLWTRLHQEQERFNLSYTASDHGAFWTKEIWRRAEKAFDEYDIFFESRWEGWCTEAWPAPCTDGEYAYVATANNAVAAVSLADGSIKWMVWEKFRDAKGNNPRKWDETGMSTRFANDPVLYKDIFVMNQNMHVRAYDKRTGKKLWEHWAPYGLRKNELKTRGGGNPWTPDKGDMADLDWNALLAEWTKSPKGKVLSRSKPEANAGCVVEIPIKGGGALPAFYDGSLFLYRLEDGKLLRHDMPFSHNQSVVVYGNAVMKGNNITHLTHLLAKDRDTVETCYLHKVLAKDGTKGMEAYPGNKHKLQTTTHTTVAHDGWWYVWGVTGLPNVGNRSTARVSIRDASVYEHVGGNIGGGFPSPILVGDRIYGFPGSKVKIGFLLMHEWNGIGDACWLDLKSGKVKKVPNAMHDNRIKDDEEYALRYAYMRPGCYITAASPYAQANRIFMRTRGTVFCIGDPKEKFPVSESWPVQGKVK